MHRYFLSFLLPALCLLQANPAPKALGLGEQQQIAALHEKHRHRAVRQADGSLTAENPGQQWNLRFDGQGFTVASQGGGWTWGLELQRFGWAGQERTTGKARTEVRANQVVYAREGVEEWFVNDRRGLEQGFTVARPPSGVGDTLTFELAIRGSLLAQVEERSASFTDGAGRGVLTFGGLKAWDADGRVLKAAFEKTADGGLRYRVEVAGARYPVTVDPLAQQAYLKASNTSGGDWFGASVAISGNTVVVGARNEDSNGTNQANDSVSNAGAAYVFIWTGVAWEQQAYLKASAPAEDEGFGTSVAISGDTLVVGAPGSANTGAVYVFTRSGTSWTEQARLTAAVGVRAAQFGSSVAISGNRVVVGAPHESDTGAAYVFTRSGVVWSQIRLTASNAGDDDRFGDSVGISGDRVIVGARWEDSQATGVNGDGTDNGANDSGAAYIFSWNGLAWVQQAYLKASNTGVRDHFGSSVSVDGDTAVVGAHLEASNATGVNGDQTNNAFSGAGAAYVFTWNGTNWGQQAYLKASNTGAGDRFGSSVAITGDMVVVGAGTESSGSSGVNSQPSINGAISSGAAYVFRRSGSTWSQEAYLKASNTGGNDFFGNSVAVAGNTLVVGAFGEASSATGVNGNQANDDALEAGAAYVFNIFPGRLTITGGNNQSATINSAFATRFQVTVRDAANNPIPNVTVTFAAPAAGASGTFAGGVNTAVTNASGVALAPVFTANGTAGGPYNVVASIVNGTNTVNFVLTNTPPPTVQITVTTNVTGPQVSVNGGAAFTGTRVFTLNVGAPFMLAAATPQLFNGGQSRWVFQNWSLPVPGTVPAVNTTFTANFGVQHQVTFTAVPPAGGTLNQASGFYDQGSVLNVQAAANPNFAFAGFGGALVGTNNPQTLAVTGPLAVVANFVPPDTYLIRYMSNLNLGDSVVNLTNTGARGAGLAAGTSAATTGAICANIYAFSPDEQMIACCSCPVTPNGLVSLSARGDLISNTLTPAVPTSIVVKLLASIPDATAGCNNAASTVAVGNLAPGLVAWGTTVKTDAGRAHIVETRFAPATLSIGGMPGNIGELGRLQQLCGFINANGSGFGICRSCRLGGLGAGRQ